MTTKRNPYRDKLLVIIFGTDIRAGRLFDLILLWAIIDLFAFLPTYIGILFTSVHFLVAIRILRLIRIFRILKLGRYFSESQELARAIWASVHRIAVFFLFLFLIVLIMGSLMYVIEEGQNGFESIPQSIYWAIITVTTVGYGDVVPLTALGKFVSSLIMIIGYSIIAVPTGIITAEIARSKRSHGIAYCTHCGRTEPDAESNFCRICGHHLREESEPEIS